MGQATELASSRGEGLRVSSFFYRIMTSIRAPTRSSSNSRAGCSSSCSGSSKYIEFRKPLRSRPYKYPILVPGVRVYLVLSVPYLVDRVSKIRPKSR
ncbi:hypothetical protein NE237_014207 [Protea cynaroides]|uniref:Uncharacterized protein n=1 Tax=Protea cynaroides TaxID=273540 RepID=A0A9Q0GMU1_9MAGN|nr:hypothetical protein NE237_014207 [Protea cynaroides]